MTPRFFSMPAALLLTFSALPKQTFAADLSVTQIPDEYESNSAFSASMNNAGYAANDPHSAIRANPALLGSQKAYSIAAGYHWPVEGRDYFQASVVDTKTSNIAAGVSYTGFMDEFRYNDSENPDVSRFDSPLEKRGVIAVAHPVGGGMVGIGGTWVRSRPLYSSDERRAGRESVQGTGLNLGMAYPVTPQLMVGAASENISNPKIRNYVPKTHKAGLAYTSGTLTGMFDVRQRERVQEFEGEQVSFGNTASSVEDEPERMAIATVTAKMQNYLKITGSYGHSLSDGRKQLGGGVSLESQGFALSYTANRPYLAKSTAHQSIALVLDIAM